MQRIKHPPRAWRRSAALSVLALAVLALAACGQEPARHTGEWNTRVYANLSRWMGEGQPNQLTYPYYDGQNMHSDTSLLVPLPTDLCDVDTLTARAWYLPLLSRWESALLGVDGVVRFYTYTDGAGWATSASLEPFAFTDEEPNDLTLLGYDRLGEQEALLCVMQRSTHQLRFLYTQDGRTWRTQAKSSLEEIGVLDLVSQERPNDFLTPAVFFLTPQEGYLWGHGTARAVWRTADGGKTWKQAYPGTPEGLSVSEAALYHSFGIFSVNVLGGQPQLIVNGGDGSTFFLVERAGDGWRASCTGSLPLPTPTPVAHGLAWQERHWAYFEAADPGSPAALRAFSPDGPLLRIDSPRQSEASFISHQTTGVYMPQEQRWDLAECLDGTLTLWRVAGGEEGGKITAEWQPQLPSAIAAYPLAGVLDYEWFDENTAVLALLAGDPLRLCILQTRDGADTWELASQRLLGTALQSSSTNIRNLRFLTPELGFLSGPSSKGGFWVYRTQDAGRTWEMLDLRQAHIGLDWDAILEICMDAGSWSAAPTADSLSACCVYALGDTVYIGVRLGSEEPVQVYSSDGGATWNWRTRKAPNGLPTS